jgi:hypothetical protein
MRTVMVLSLCAALVFCSRKAVELQDQIAGQEKVLAAAQAAHDREVTHLKEIRDSLQVRIGRNVDLGMEAKQAEAVERALLASQEAVVKAGERDLKLKREYLALLKKRLHALTGGP